MKFHKWVDLDHRNRVCKICNRHERTERLRGHALQLIVREGVDEEQCTSTGRLRRFFTHLSFGLKRG